MKTLRADKDISDKAELVDGIWPDTPAYIGFASHKYIDLTQLIRNRLAEGFCMFSVPAAEHAAETIDVLRKYADELERLFVRGEWKTDDNIKPNEEKL